MALTRPTLKEILSKAGVSAENMDDAIKEIIAGHTATVDALKERIDAVEKNVETVEKLKADADKYKTELEEAKKTIADGEKYKNDYDTLKAEYDGYKADVETKAAKATSDATFTKWLRENGYTEKGAAKIVKYGGFTPEFNKDGTIKNADKLSESVNAEWSEYKASEKTEGAKTETPPANTGGNTITREDILKLPNTAARQKAIAENGALFGIK